MKTKEKFLDDLGGEERDIKIVKTPNSDYINELGIEVLNKFYTSNNPINIDAENIEYYYNNIFHYVAPKIKKINYDDLTFFIHANLNIHDNNNYSKTSPYFFLGAYSGCLLHILTQIHPQRYYINGLGQRFDYLFCGANYFDELIVDNFESQGLCKGVGLNGEGNLLLTINNEANACSNIAYNGHIKDIAIINNEGSFLFDLCKKGKSDFILGLNSEGSIDWSVTYTVSGDKKIMTKEIKKNRKIDKIYL
ncbi:hypothetical protein ACFL1H_08080, partial [Nanoarchaeota archaeon]